MQRKPPWRSISSPPVPAVENLAEANHYRPNDPEWAHRCQAQARSMMREARGFRSLLLRVQAARHKREADATALGKAEWIEHCAIGLMANAAGIAPPPARSEPPPPPASLPEQEEPASDLAAEADQYAIIYPRRAASIRACGGLPPRCDFGPPSPELTHAIATGTSPTLRALDSPAEALV